MLIAELTPWYGTPFAGMALLYLVWQLNRQNSETGHSENTSEYSRVKGLEPTAATQETLRELARQGHASSLAEFTWVCLNSGNFRSAIELYEETRHSLFESAAGAKYMPMELANCDSNHALNLLGSGKSMEEVAHLWMRNQTAGHLECVFYGLISKIRTGEVKKSDIALFPEKSRTDFLRLLREGKTSQGWYRDWCNDLLIEFESLLES